MTTTTPKALNFIEVYNQYKSEISAFLKNKIKSEEEREDLLANVHLKLYKHLESYDCSKGQINTWLFTVVNNMVIDHYRSARGKNTDMTISKTDLANSEGEEAFEVMGEGTASSDMENKELHLKIRRAIRTLNSTEKKIAILRFIKEMDYTEIAEILEMPLGSVKVTIMRAKESLQITLKTEYAML